MKYRCLTAVVAFLFLGIVCFAQQSGIEALRKDYPLLMDKFGNELENQRADYYFLVDVSGTMQQYTGIVVPALQEFFRSMQTNDYVSVIKFGGEAKNDIGSQGMVNADVVKSLINYVPNLYQIPGNAADKRVYFSYTDLEAMMQYLTKELHQAGRNNLKFVFIITDFVHDPMPERKGKENWDAIKSRLESEQIDNFLYAFALQLPGKDAGRDLNKVRGVFPMPIELEEVKDQAALSEWFTHKKNSILLDKFTALIKNKIQDPQIEMTPEFTIDGCLTLHTSWKQNALFEQLSVNEIVPDNHEFVFKPALPHVISLEQDKANVGTLAYQSKSSPCLHSYDGTVTANISLTAPYLNELVKLGLEQAPVSYKMPVKTSVFTFYMSFWPSVILASLLLIYLLLVFGAIKRNSSARSRVSGQFIVRLDDNDVTSWKRCESERVITIGKGASFLPVDHTDCDWLIEIKMVTSWPIFLKKPVIECKMRKGRKFKIGRKEYLNHQHPRIYKGTRIDIGDFKVIWKA